MSAKAAFSKKCKKIKFTDDAYENEEEFFPPPPEDMTEEYQRPEFKISQPPTPDLDYPPPWTPSSQGHAQMPPKFSIPTKQPPAPPLSLTIPKQRSFDSVSSSLPEPPTPPIQAPIPPPPPPLMDQVPPPPPPLLNQSKQVNIMVTTKNEIVS